MGEIVQFVPKSERERMRLIREARAIYDSIFPSAPAGKPADETQPKQVAGSLPVHGREGVRRS